MKKRMMTSKPLLFFIFLSFAALPLIALAADGDETFVETKKKKEAVIYERPTMKSLSQLYWAIRKFKPSDDEALDNFLMINECDLYREYVQNEFEWIGIRESAREFVQANRNNFPTHFELLQPIRLAEYNIEKGEFFVAPEYNVDGVRRFEIMAEDLYNDVCDKGYGEQIIGYPKGLHVELSRPFSLISFKVHPELAKIYIENINRGLKEREIFVTNKEQLYDERVAYVVMRIRIISHKEDANVNNYHLSKMLGLLESYTIYGDRERDLVLFEEDFKRKRKLSKAEVEMKKRYQERLKRQMEEKRKKEQMEQNIEDINNIKNTEIEE